MEEQRSDEVPSSAYDAIAENLVALRAECGHPSYAEIALRVGRLREQRGVPRAEARPGRTTVYDAFRPGRRRINAELIVDIVRALGGDDDAAARWAEACRTARAETEAVSPARPPDQSTGSDEPGPGSSAPVPAQAVTWRRGLITAAVCVVLNLLLAEFVYLIQVPLFLDMVGTALAAIVLGPWWGAAVGLGTNLGMSVTQGPQAIPFAIVNIGGALMWGYGVRRFRMGEGLRRFFVLNVAVGLGCTVIAAPIVYLVFGGAVGHGADSVMARILDMSHHLLLAVVSANLLTSLADKLLSGLLALVAIESLPVTLASGRDHVHLVPVEDDAV